MFFFGWLFVVGMSIIRCMGSLSFVVVKMVFVMVVVFVMLFFMRFMEVGVGLRFRLLVLYIIFFLISIMGFLLMVEVGLYLRMVNVGGFVELWFIVSRLFIFSDLIMDFFSIVYLMLVVLVILFSLLESCVVVR